MKKRILALLTALTALVCVAFASCNPQTETGNPTQTEQSAGSEKSDGKGTQASGNPSNGGAESPDFPDNDYGKDNEESYPNAWN